MDTLPISLRQATAEDLPFIRSSWFESYRKGGYAPNLGFDLYRAGHGPLIDRLTADSFLTVAYATEVPDEICGWVCADIRAVHYIYVKQAYRRRGIATRLFKLYDAAVFHTHETQGGRLFARKHGTRFNPYPLYHSNNP